jgi:fibronectin-binding autotransporter adhesin
MGALFMEQLEPRQLLANVFWIGGSGDWVVGANWSNGIGPGADDDAVIDVAGASVTHSTGSHAVKSLTIDNPFTLSGGTLVVNGNLLQQNANTFAITGGILESATVVGEGGAVLTAANATLDGVTLGATVGGLPLAANVQVNEGSITVTGGLTFANGSKLDLGTHLTLVGNRSTVG